MPQIIITASPAVAQRVAHCVGTYLGLNDGNGNMADATMAQVTQECRKHLQMIVRKVEASEATAAALAAAQAPVDLT